MTAWVEISDQHKAPAALPPEKNLGNYCAPEPVCCPCRYSNAAPSSPLCIYLQFPDAKVHSFRCLTITAVFFFYFPAEMTAYAQSVKTPLNLLDMTTKNITRNLRETGDADVNWV